MPITDAACFHSQHQCNLSCITVLLYQVNSVVDVSRPLYHQLQMLTDSDTSNANVSATQSTQSTQSNKVRKSAVVVVALCASFVMPPPQGSILEQHALSICLFHDSCLGYRHTGCLQLSHRRPREMCGLRTCPWTDIDLPRFLDRTAVGAPADGLSSVKTNLF